MTVRLFCLGLGATDSLSDDLKILNSSHSSLKTVKHSGASIMMWRCFSYYDVESIYHIPGIVDQFEYIRIFVEVMLLYAEEEMFLKWLF